MNYGRGCLLDITELIWISIRSLSYRMSVNSSWQKNRKQKKNGWGGGGEWSLGHHWMEIEQSKFHWSCWFCPQRSPHLKFSTGLITIELRLENKKQTVIRCVAYHHASTECFLCSALCWTSHSKNGIYLFISTNCSQTFGCSMSRQKAINVTQPLQLFNSSRKFI